MFKKLERAGASLLGGRGFRLLQGFGFRSAFSLIFVFTACFALSFLAGSLAFIPHQTTATLNLDVAAESSLASSLNPSNLELTLNPTPLGTQVTGELTTTVTTDNPTGYKLTLQTKTSNTSLTHLNGIDTIPMTTNSTPNTLINNTWGFNPTSSATIFQSIPADGQTPYTLTQTTSPTTPTGETATITIGAKANTSIPAGLYTNVITFTATANPLPAPTITSVTPATGPTTGGTSITIAGTNFSASATATVGGAPCTSVTVVSLTSITCNTPTGTAGARVVAVTTPSGTATTTAANGFTYVAAPTITDVFPSAGPVTEGTVIFISGTNFVAVSGLSAVTVTVDGLTCSDLTRRSDTLISCTTPINTAGARDVVVTNAGGSATITGGFTYVAGATLTNNSNIQSVTKNMCSATAAGTTVNLRDTRDNKVYRVRKMIDGNCWFIDNLAFQLNNAVAPTFSPAAALISGTTTSVNSQAQYIQNAVAYNTADGQRTYLYNWCAALGDTTSSCSVSAAADTNNTVINGTLNTAGTTTDQPAVTGICPAPFRLPKGGPEATTSNPPSTANEFAKLDITMGGTGTDRLSANTHGNWMNTTNNSSSWSGVFSGRFNSSLVDQGSVGYWWSSTANSSTNAYYLYLGGSSSYVYPAYNALKRNGLAVRCVL